MNQKHPIDELFRSKLVNYELSPEAKMKQIFLNKTQPKKKRILPFWIFSIAASFIAVLSFFWITNSDDSINNTQTLSLQTSSQEASSPIIVEQNIPELTLTETFTVKTETGKVKPVRRITNQQVNLSTEIQTTETFANISPTGMAILDEPIPDELTLALIESEKRESENVNENNKAKNSTFFKKDVGETIIIVASEFKKKELILLPEINADSPMTMVAATEMARDREEENNSLLAKVFTNIKHLKHGEKLDLIQTARFESNEDTFIGNEKREIEEKISWIKSRIAKR